MAKELSQKLDMVMLVNDAKDQFPSQTQGPKPRSNSSESAEIRHDVNQPLTIGLLQANVALSASCECVSAVALTVKDHDFRFYRRYYNSRRAKPKETVNTSFFPGVRTLTAMLLGGCRSQSASRVQDGRRDGCGVDDEERDAEFIELCLINDDFVMRGHKGHRSQESDANHVLIPLRITALLWCDKCGQPIVSVYKHCFVCKFCQFTCHEHCRQLITVQCPNTAASLLRGRRPSRVQTETSLTEYAALWSEPPSSALVPFVIPKPSDDLLKSLIDEFNKNNQGLLLEMENEDDSSYSGFVRIYMNLCRPITMCVSVCPPSTVLTHCEPDHVDLNYTTHVTSFYMPRGTSKVINITSKTTTQDVIRTLLGKFNITDNPRKFVLYERFLDDERKQACHLRKLQEDETPLALCLHWTQTDGHVKLSQHQFMLQENDPGEVMWEIFSVPELENFLLMLGLEERDGIERVKVKYFRLRILLLRRLAELNRIML